MSIGKLVNEAREALIQADHVLNEAVFEKIMALFFLCRQQSESLAALTEIAKEFGREEFLPNCDRQGALFDVPVDVLFELENAVTANAQFASWFRIASVNGTRIVLVGRWLAHLLGFRHVCAHIFLDDAIRRECTWIQIRSLGKTDSPGLLDIPVGGHVKGVASVEQTAVAELREELNLDVARDVMSFCRVAEYEVSEVILEKHFHNVEHRVVFLGSLKAQALRKIRFVDAEVAAVCMFSVSELGALLRQHPEMFASGLVGSLPAYKTHKGL